MLKIIDYIVNLTFRSTVSMLSGSLIQELSDLASIVRGDPRPFGGLQVRVKLL